MSVMGKLRDAFSKKPKEEAVEIAEEVKKPEAEATPVPAKKAAPSVEPASQPAPVVARKIDEERLCRVILGVRMSEKSVRLSEKEQHVFEVLKDATREEVKSAVETMFGVKVNAVRMTNVRGKTKRKGRRNDWSKAYVRLEPGQNLEGMEIGA